MKFYLLPNKDEAAHACVFRYIFVFFCVTLSLQIWRIYTLNATYDQGLFLQEIWNSANGRFFESTLASELSAPVMFDGALPEVGYRHLAQHFTPLLLFWTPLVRFLGLWSLPLIQVGMISLGGYILFLLANEYLPPKLSAWIVFSYFSTTLVIGPALENFHDLCVIPCLIFCLLLGITRNQIPLYFLSSILLPLVREDVGLLGFGVGVWMIIRRPNWRLFGLGLCLYSCLAVIVITNSVMPMFGTELADRFMQERFGQFLDGRSGGTIDVLLSMISQPILLIQELFSPPGKTFLFLITAGLPLAFIPLIALDTWLLIAFPLFVALSSQGGNSLVVHLRFVLYLVPGIFAGTIFWLADHPDLFKRSFFRKFWRFCLIIAFAFALAANPHRALSFVIPDSIDPWVKVPLNEQLVRGKVARQVVNLIPRTAAVSAETHLIPQLAQRQVLLRFPENDQYIDEKGHHVSVDFIASQPRFNLSYAPAFNHHKLWVSKSINRLEELVETSQYTVFYCDKHSIILEYNGSTNARNEECFVREMSSIRGALQLLN